tara:strand:- start:161 stop:367 length:207 start_codon:yes stop_codon:yes gene_type:complete
MIKFTPDKYIAYEKIMKVIDSCKTKDHLDAAKNMVITFEKQFNITIKNKEMIRDLYSHLHIKRAILKG